MSRLQHRVAVLPEPVPHESSYPLFVLHQQNRFHAVRGPIRHLAWLRRCGGFIDSRQIDREGGPSSKRALNLDAAAALFDDPIDGREPEPRSFPLFLRGEERLKDVRLCRGIHPAPGVTHYQLHIRTRLGGSELASRGLGRLDVAGLDRELASLWHGVTSVDGQVHDDLLELAGISFHPTQGGVHPGDQLDILADQAPQHFLKVPDDGIEVHHLRIEHLFPAEGEELADQ